MKAFLDYLQEIQIVPNLNITVEFKDSTVTMEFIQIPFINNYFPFCSYLYLHQMDSYNIIYTRIAEEYLCRSQMIFYKIGILNSSFQSKIYMRFL